jgi:hypothetical protein
MERAMREGLKATKRVDGSFRVPSVSEPGKVHIVTLDEAGHIVDCSDCKGWERYGRSNPCKHAGAVAIGLAYLQGAHIVSTTYMAPSVIESSCRGRSQVLTTEAGA